MLAGTGLVLPTAQEGTISEPSHLCDGSTLDKTDHADLFSVIGTQFNTGGEPANHFRLPNIPDLITGVRYVIVG